MLTLEELKTKLDSDQLAAVTAPKGNILCVANAGSGKTRVLTHRIAWQIGQGEPEDSFLMLTFTVKAAKEMRERICKLLGKKDIEIMSGTFHSVAWRFIIRFYGLLGLPKGLTILDDTDSSDLFGLCREYVCAYCDGDRKKMPTSGSIAGTYSFCRNTGQTVRDYNSETHVFEDCYMGMVEDVIEEYEKRKEKNKVVDFDDLLILFDRLLDVPQFKTFVHAQYQNIFVDEFQDINVVQSSIITKLNDGVNHLTAVGDDAQCIYCWRGSDISFIRQFPQTYPNVTVYPIRNNYRSSSPIVDMALSVINESPDYEKQPKVMLPTIPGKVKPQYKEYKGFYAERDMVDAIVKDVQRAHDNGTPWEEIAILFRMNRLPKLLEAKLEAAHIPVSMECGYPFYSRAHIRPILNYLRFMLNPANELAFWSLMGLVEGIGKKTAQGMFEAFTGYKCDIDMLGELATPKKSSTEFRNLVSAIQVGYNRASHPDTTKKTSLPQQLLELFYQWFLKAHMEKEYGDKETDQELKTRLHDFQIIYDAMANLSVADFLANIALTTERDKNDRSAVRLLTSHKAKGLEWDHVIIPYVNDQVFPVSYDIMEEERRLFYVSVTRARKTLALYSCRGRLRTWPTYAGDRSPFMLGNAWACASAKIINAN